MKDVTVTLSRAVGMNSGCYEILGKEVISYCRREKYFNLLISAISKI